MAQQCVFVQRSKRIRLERSRIRKAFEESGVTVLQGHVVSPRKHAHRHKEMERHFPLNFGSRTAFSSKPLLREGFQGFILRNRGKVIKFVNENQFLRELIERVRLRIREFFPKEDLVLEVVEDDDANESQLVIYIRTSLTPQEAYSLLKLLDDKYWLLMSRAEDPNSLLSINLEFN